MLCWKCGAEIDTTERVGFRDYCRSCEHALHCCRNCGFYDPSSHNQCREPMAEPVVDKERFNFCEYFTPGRAPLAAATRSASGTRARLDALFRKKS